MTDRIRPLPKRDRVCYPTDLPPEMGWVRRRNDRIRTLWSGGWPPNAIAQQVGWPTVIVCVVLGLRPETRWLGDGEIIV